MISKQAKDEVLEAIAELCPDEIGYVTYEKICKILDSFTISEDKVKKKHHPLCITGTQPVKSCTHCKELRTKETKKNLKAGVITADIK